MSTKFIGTLAFLVIVLLLSVIFYSSYTPQPGIEIDQKGDLTKTSPTERVIKHDIDVVLAAFPAGFPAGSEIQQASAYKYIPADSLEQQATIEYTSQRSFA